jgi:hypothetical protein
MPGGILDPSLSSRTAIDGARVPPQQHRTVWVTAAFAALVAVALAGYFVVHARSGAHGTLQPAAAVALPSPTPST